MCSLPCNVLLDAVTEPDSVAIATCIIVVFVAVKQGSLALELCIPEFVPELLCYTSAIIDQTITCDIVADILDITC